MMDSSIAMTTEKKPKNNKEKILRYLARNPKIINTSDLASATGIDNSNISRYLIALEKDGKIIREVNQNGKLRSVNISLRSVENNALKLTDRKQEINLKNNAFSSEIPIEGNNMKVKSESIKLTDRKQDQKNHQGLEKKKDQNQNPPDIIQYKYYNYHRLMIQQKNNVHNLQDIQLFVVNLLHSWIFILF